MEIAPVILIIFNRPDFTAIAFEAIAKARPRKLLIVADGPRNTAEEALCVASRQVTERVNWDCEVYRDYARTNLGCYNRIVSGLNWAFSLVDDAIILEDDMVPDPSLFLFVTELLDKYRYDESVFTIGGFSPYPESSTLSYAFSNYPLTWGWGTWQRAWREFDGELKEWSSLRRTQWLENRLCDPNAAAFYRQLFDAASSAASPGRFPTPWGPELVDAWDFLWTYSIWAKNGTCVAPAVSMVRNLGFREDSTNVKDPDNHLARVTSAAMKFPLVHPATRLVDTRRDAWVFFRWQGWRKLTLMERARMTLASYPPLRAAFRRVRGVGRRLAAKLRRSTDEGHKTIGG